jgi:hypothetical protein
MSIRDCLDKLSAETASLAFNGNTVLLMKRVKYALENPRDFPDMDMGDAGHTGMALHMMTRRFPPNNAFGTKYYRTLWAAPGMTDFLLNETLISRTLQAEMEKYPEGFDIDKVCEADQDELQGWGRHPDLSTSEFSYLIFNLLVKTVVAGKPSHASINDGDGEIRSGMDSLVLAAAQRTMDLFINRFVRKSCGDIQLAAAPSFVNTVVAAKFAPDKVLEKIEFNKMKLFSACLDEFADDVSALHYVCTFLEKTFPKYLMSSEGLPDANDREIFFLVVRLLCRIDVDNGERDRAERIVCFYLRAVLKGPRYIGILEETVRTPYKRGHSGGKLPLAAFQEDTEVHAIAVYLLAKIMRHALIPLHLTCRGGVPALLDRYKCNNKDVMMRIAMFAADPEKALGTGPKPPRKRFKGWERHQKPKKHEFVQVIEECDDLRQRRCTAEDNGGDDGRKYNYLFCEKIGEDVEPLALKMLLYKEVLSEAEFSEVSDLYFRPTGKKSYI